MTLLLLWEECRRNTPDGYGYSQFCQLYRDRLGRQEITLRQEYRTGQKLFVDYAGNTNPIKATSKVTPDHLFVAVLG